MKTWLKILIALFLFGIIAGVLGYFFVYNKPHPDYLIAKPFKSLTASELYQAYITDRQSAEEEYNGKMLQISGNIDAVEESGNMVAVVFSFETGTFGDEGVRCTMHTDFNNAALQRQVGDFVTLKGVCNGFTDIDVILEKCSIVE